MSRERNAAIVERYFEECLNAISGPDRAHALSILDEILAPDFLMLYGSETDGSRGRDSHKAFVVDHAQAYPEDHWTIEALVATEQTVACQWRITATHAKTGNRIDVRAADFYTMRDEQFVELRRFLDFADLRRQTRAPRLG